MNARLALTAMLLMMSIASGSATIRISDDHGGQIGGYLARPRRFGCPANGLSSMASAPRRVQCC